MWKDLPHNGYSLYSFKERDLSSFVIAPWKKDSKSMLARIVFL